MAIEIGNRTKILAGVVLLVALGALAWVFFLEEFLSEPPPKPAAVAKAAPKQADAAKPAAEAPKAGDTAKAPAAAPKQGDAAKAPGDAPKAAAAKPVAKPIPANPDKLIAEVIETSGIKAQFQAFGREAALKAMGGFFDSQGATESRAVVDMFERIYGPEKMNEELAANLKKNLDVERMGRFLELLRQPIALKMTSQEVRAVTPEVVKEFQENFRKDPPPPGRVKLFQSLDDVTHTSEVAFDMSSVIASSLVDTMLGEMQKSGKNIPKLLRQFVGSRLHAMRDQARSQIRSVLYVTYRNASDEELAEYLKLLDTDTGRWGSEALSNAVRPVLISRGGALGVAIGKLAMSKGTGAMAKAAAASKPEAQEEEKPAEKPTAPVAAAPAAPVEVPGYRRAANIRDVYSTKYNDVVTATVMRDRGAVAELLGDGKNPNARQKDGSTALMIAAANGDTEIATLLLAKGADPNPRAGRSSALSIAKSRGSAGAGMVQLLERSGAKD